MIHDGAIMANGLNNIAGVGLALGTYYGCTNVKEGLGMLAPTKWPMR